MCRSFLPQRLVLLPGKPPDSSQLTHPNHLPRLTAVAILVVHLAAPNSPSFLNLYFVLGRCESSPQPFVSRLNVSRVYTNALLAALNIRKHLREHPSGNGVELSLSNGKHSSRVLDRSVRELRVVGK
jgi:hypothetical protein